MLHQLIYNKTAKAGNQKARAGCELSEGGGCISPKDEGSRRLRFTAGLARFFCFSGGKGKGSDCMKRNVDSSEMEQYVYATGVVDYQMLNLVLTML
ncbi:hypothetical protein [Gelidibacter gilvus]|uniref:hypothetical protein n=1 Tax=Gelidibacter gilvus TaxID=59602 RepID=UPI00100B9657|nr:hypothetical protein [Gelidibacter gilvus]